MLENKGTQKSSQIFKCIPQVPHLPNHPPKNQKFSLNQSPQFIKPKRKSQRKTPLNSQSKIQKIAISKNEFRLHIVPKNRFDDLIRPDPPFANLFTINTLHLSTLARYVNTTTTYNLQFIAMILVLKNKRISVTLNFGLFKNFFMNNFALCFVSKSRFKFVASLLYSSVGKSDSSCILIFWFAVIGDYRLFPIISR